MAGRWKVERTGAPSGLGYGRGWVATNVGTGTGAWFPTWRRALSFVNRELLLDAIRHEQEISRLALRGVSRNVRRVR